MTVNTTTSNKTPLLVFLAAAFPGHMVPTLHVAREMAKRGFGIAFMAQKEYRGTIEKMGGLFWEQPDMLDAAIVEERNKKAHGPDRLVYDLTQLWIPGIPSRHQRLRELLEMLRAREPLRDIIVVAEIMSLAALPFRLGAPLPTGYTTLPRIIGLNVVVLINSSIDTAPFGFGLLPDDSESGRQRNELLHQLVMLPFASAIQLYRETLLSLGCDVSRVDACRSMFDSFVEMYDTTLQLCSPGLEYPRSDLHHSIRYAGTLPLRELDPNLVYPAWWSDVTENSSKNSKVTNRRKIVLVAQGTLAVSYDELIVPTIRGLACRSDILVVATLGVKGAELQEYKDQPLPENVRVIDYFPYDAVLAHADVFITNGGYGGTNHAIMNGVPLVVAGITEDKIEVSARIAYAGIGVNLRTQTPTSEAIAAGVDEVLASPRFRARTERLRLESEDLDPLSIIERELRKGQVN